MKLWSKTLAVLLALMCAMPLSWAKVTIDPSFTGTLIVTLADGTVSLYESGDALPDIPQGATLEVFDGSISLTTEAGDQIQVGCFGDERGVGGGSSVTLSCGESSGTLKIDDTEYVLSGNAPETADPTAESDVIGVPSDQVGVPDSRSIQASTVS